MGTLEAEKQKKDIFDYITYFKDLCKENDTKNKINGKYSFKKSYRWYTEDSISNIQRSFINSLDKDKSSFKSKLMMSKGNLNEQIKMPDKHIKLPKDISPKRQ